jgi:hypothetical protein
MSIATLPDNMTFQVIHNRLILNNVPKKDAVRMQRLNNLKKNLFNLSEMIDESVLDINYNSAGINAMSPEAFCSLYFQQDLYSTVIVPEEQITKIAELIAEEKQKQSALYAAVKKENMDTEITDGGIERKDDEEVNQEVLEAPKEKKKKKKKKSA